jgi:hypothetical protein
MFHFSDHQRCLAGDPNRLHGFISVIFVSLPLYQLFACMQEEGG